MEGDKFRLSGVISSEELTVHSVSNLESLGKQFVNTIEVSVRKSCFDTCQIGSDFSITKIQRVGGEGKEIVNGGATIKKEPLPVRLDIIGTFEGFAGVDLKIVWMSYLFIVWLWALMKRSGIYKKLPSQYPMIEFLQNGL